MNVAISICEHERAMALAWFEWVAELGQTAGHSLFLLPADGMDAKEVIGAAEKAFPGAVTALRDEEAVKSDWQGADAARSAAGPNSSFRQFAWHFYHAKSGAWLWIELDAIPLRAGWIDAIEAEYGACGKPFLGAEVNIDKVPPHLSGNAVYPENVPVLAPSLVMRTNWISGDRAYELAFDIAGAKEVLPQAHFSNLVQHKFRHPGFKSREEFEATIDPRAVVFHSNKDGSLIRILRGDYVTSALLAEADAMPDPPRYLFQDGKFAQATSTTDTMPNPNWTTVPREEKRWEIVETREALVRDTVAILKQLCTAPSYIAQVRKELKTQGVTK